MRFSVKFLFQAIFHIGLALANGYVHFMAPEEITRAVWPWLAGFWLLLTGFTIHHTWIAWCHRQDKKTQETEKPKKSEETKDEDEDNQYKPDTIILKQKEIIFQTTHGDLHLDMTAPHKNVKSVADWLIKNGFMEKTLDSFRKFVIL